MYIQVIYKRYTLYMHLIYADFGDISNYIAGGVLD